MTGVDTLVERSGVSKTSLYRVFESKDEVVDAVLAEKDEAYWAWWDSLVASASTDPAERLRAVIKGICRHIAGPARRGCPFQNAAAELPEHGHLARARIAAHMRELEARCADLARGFGGRQPKRSGKILAMLINGAYASAGVGAVEHLEENLMLAATAVVKAYST